MAVNTSESRREMASTFGIPDVWSVGHAEVHMSPEEKAKQLAIECGFTLQGIANVPESGIAPRAEALRSWLSSGHHGPLEYLEKSVEVRANVLKRFDWAQSVLCVGAFHDPKARGERGRELVAHVARYARGRDYHLIFEKRLKRLSALLRTEGLCRQAHWYVDSGPVLERAWAESAGLGWIGKNSCLIHPRKGSYFLMGVILLDAALRADRPHTFHCGTCTKCIEACPTQALRAPGILDASRCITTWNLEQKSEVPTSHWTDFSGWAAGCDICQEVCPFNAPKRTPDADPEMGRPLPWQDLSLSDAMTISKESFDLAFKSSPLRRTGWKGMRLGAITAAGSERAPGTRAALKTCLEDPDEAIRERAAWALNQIGVPDAT